LLKSNFRPLRVRLEQVLVSQHEPVTLYKLTNLLKFYETTIKQLLPNDCQLILVLNEVSNLSSKMFLNAYVILQKNVFCFSIEFVFFYV
jgi:hypothetical protein